MPRLENWSIGGDPKNEYCPPESSLKSQGNIYGHPKFNDGDWVKTSQIKEIIGNKIRTKSGHLYELGEPDQNYVEWCERNGHYIPTREQPILVKEAV